MYCVLNYCAIFYLVICKTQIPSAYNSLTCYLQKLCYILFTICYPVICKTQTLPCYNTTIFLSSAQRAREPYRTQSPRPPEHPVTDAVIRTANKETHCARDTHTSRCGAFNIFATTCLTLVITSGNLSEFKITAFREVPPCICGQGELSRYRDSLRSGDPNLVGATFSAPAQSGPGTHPAYCIIVPGSLSQGEKRPGRGVDTQPHIAPWLKKQ